MKKITILIFVICFACIIQADEFVIGPTVTPIVFPTHPFPTMAPTRDYLNTTLEPDPVPAYVPIEVIVIQKTAWLIKGMQYGNVRR